METKACPFCHKTIREDANYCIFCMHRLTNPKQIGNGKKSKSAKRKTWIWAIAAAAAMILIALMILIFPRNKKSGHTADLPGVLKFSARAKAVIAEEGDPIWDPDDLTEHLHVQKWSVYQEKTGLDDVPFTIAFHDETNEIVFGIENYAAADQEKVIQMAEQVLSGIAGYYSDDLSEVLSIEKGEWTEMSRNRSAASQAIGICFPKYRGRTDFLTQQFHSRTPENHILIDVLLTRQNDEWSLFAFLTTEEP